MMRGIRKDMRKIFRLIYVISFLLIFVGCGKDSTDNNLKLETEHVNGPEDSEIEYIDETKTPVNSTEISKLETTEQEMISTENTDVSSEKESSEIRVSTTSEPKDEFIEEICVLYSLEPVILYNAPSFEADIIMEWESYTSIALDAYNEKTGWYRTSMGYDEPMYCRMDNGLTLNEFRAILNEGVEGKYYCLGCVSEPERYARAPYATYISRVENLACVHIRRKHNFVPVEVAEECNEASYNARVEWHEMVHAVDNQDGTVNIWTKEQYLPIIVSLEEYYEKYQDAGVVLYKDSDTYLTAKDEYQINAMLEVLNSY